MIRRPFTLDADQYAALLIANNSRRQVDAAEAVRCFWISLGRELGFDPNTVALDCCDVDYSFTATLTRTEAPT